MDDYREGGRNKHGSNVPAASVQPGELGHPLVCRAGEPVRNHVLENGLLPWTRKGGDMLRAQSVNSVACPSESIGVSSTVLCLDLLLEYLGMHR